MSEIRSNIMESLGPIVGIAIAVVVIVTIAGMGILSANSSANLVSATTQMLAFVGLIGLGVGLSIFLRVLGKI